MRAAKWLATAESCTGGLVAGAITAVAGSSAWFDRGFVTYSNEAKIEQLGVSRETLATLGAVSAQTAAEMAAGALPGERGRSGRSRSPGLPGRAAARPTNRSARSASAGPGRGASSSEPRLLAGDRAGIRRDSVRIALQGLIDRLA